MTTITTVGLEDEDARALCAVDRDVCEDARVHVVATVNIVVVIILTCAPLHGPNINTQQY